MTKTAAPLTASLELGHELMARPDRQYCEHLREARYLLPPPADRPVKAPDRKELYIHAPAPRRPS